MSVGFLSEEVFANGPWHYFERAIARYLVHKGWENVELVAGTGDKGADIIASISDDDYVIQVKYSKSNTDLTADIVGDVVRAMDFYKIKKGLCISNRNLGAAQKKKLKTFQQTGYEIGSFTSGSLLNSFNKMPVWRADKRIPRRYQQECIETLKGSFDSGDSRGLICLATGMGKTFVACSLLQWLYKNNENLNTLVLAHNKELLYQFEWSVWTFIPKSVSTHLLSGELKPMYSGGILLSTFGSFPKWYDSNMDNIFDIVIVDEAHHSRASTYENVINMLNPAYKLGLTATPYRTDRLSITDFFGDPLVYYDVSKAIKHKFLSEVDYRLKNDNIDHDWIAQKSKMGYTVKQLNKKLFIPERDETICNIFIDYWKTYNRRRGIIFCNSKKHCKDIEKILRTIFNFPARSLTNDVDNRENARRLRSFRKGDVKVLTAFDMLNEGVDVPSVDIICFMRVTHSRTYFLQQLGRGLRYKEGKQLLVLDFVADIRRVKAVKRLYEDYINEEDTEYLNLEKGFSLEFSDSTTADFLELVTTDEELDSYDDNHKIYIN